MKPITFLFTVTIASLLVMTPYGADAGSIKKCQDAQGRWYYGNSAAKACARSEVIEFSAGKVGKKIVAPPPTQDELNASTAKKRTEEQKKQRLAEQAEQDKLLTASYAHEDDIIYERDRKLKDLESGIESGTATLNSLQAVRDRALKRAEEEKAGGKGVSKATQKTLSSAERQVKRHQQALLEKNREMAEMKLYYDDALKRYRAMKQRRATKAE
ncbi:MAG: hypothetical protein ACC641_09965 [Acidiferrobacterales bacterium]